MAKRLKQLKSLDKLHKLNQAEFKTIWENEFKITPPSNMKALLRPLSYKYQEITIDKLSKISKKRIAYYIRMLDGGIKKKSPSKIQVNDGTVFKRTYKNKEHTVLFTNNKYLYNDKEYKSLSAIANEITGSITSGIKFFGVTRRKA